MRTTHVTAHTRSQNLNDAANKRQLLAESTDDAILLHLRKQGFFISAQDLEETRLDKEGSKISIIVKGDRD